MPPAKKPLTDLLDRVEVLNTRLTSTIEQLVELVGERAILVARIRILENTAETIKDLTAPGAEADFENTELHRRYIHRLLNAVLIKEEESHGPKEE